MNADVPRDGVSFGSFVELGADRFRGFAVVFGELLEVCDDVADGAQACEVFVGDLHAIFVLGLDAISTIDS